MAKHSSRCAPNKPCSMSPQGREWMGINYYSGGGAALFVSNAGSGDGTGSNTSNSMSLANFLNATLEAGTTVKLNKGETYNVGEIDIDVADIKFDAYGTGDNPILRGSEDISGLTWSDEGGGVYSTPMAEEPNWVWIDGVCAKLAETPRITIQSRSDTTHITVTHSDVSGYSNIVGAYLVAKDKPFSSSLRVKVTAYNGAGVITIDHGIDVNNNVDLALYNKFEFFDGDLEWAWEDGELRIKSTVSPATLNIRASAYNYCFKDTANTRFEGLEIQEYFQFGIWSVAGVSDIRNINIHDIRDTGIYFEKQVTAPNVSDFIITRCGNNGIAARPVINGTFPRGNITEIGMQDNYGWSTIDYHSDTLTVNHEHVNGSGIIVMLDLADDTLTGGGNVFEDIVISGCAYLGIGITVGSNNKIRRSSATDCTKRYQDGACFYASHYRLYDVLQEGLEISNCYAANMNGTGSGVRNGIYIDNRCEGAHVHNNTVEKCDWGILLNYDTSDHIVEDNITFNNTYGIVFRNGSAATLITDNTNNTFQRNLMVAVKSTQRCLSVEVASGSFPSWNPFGGTGLADDNMYLSPFNTDIANADNKSGDLTLVELQAAYGEDANSVARANYLSVAAFWTERLRLITNHTAVAVIESLPGWEDFDGNAIGSVPAYGAVVALVDDSENSVQLAAASLQAVNLGTEAALQVERDDLFVIAFRFKIAANPASGQVLLSNLGATDKGVQIAVAPTGTITFELRNTTTTNRYKFITGDLVDNAWHRIVIKKPVVHGDTTITVDGSPVSGTEVDNLTDTIVSVEDWYIGVNETAGANLDGLIDDLAIWLGTTDPESKYPDHFWRLGEDGYVDSGVSATRLDGTPINNPTISTDVI